MLCKFLSVKLGDRVLRADRPRIGHEAWHASPRDDLLVLLFQCSAGGKPVSRFYKVFYGFLEATRPPTHPTSMPPITKLKHRPTDRKAMDDTSTAEARGATYLARTATNPRASAARPRT